MFPEKMRSEYCGFIIDRVQALTTVMINVEHRLHSGGEPPRTFGELDRRPADGDMLSRVVRDSMTHRRPELSVAAM